MLTPIPFKDKDELPDYKQLATRPHSERDKCCGKPMQIYKKKNYKGALPHIAFCHECKKWFDCNRGDDDDIMYN